MAQTFDLREAPVAGRVTDLVGKPTSLIPTPALVVETEALERNLRLMSDFFARRHAKLRPHFKSHKCVTIARRQLENGNAVGITCAKLSEAEVLAAGGIRDILIANQIVGLDKVLCTRAAQYVQFMLHVPELGRIGHMLDLDLEDGDLVDQFARPDLDHQ